MKGGEWPVILGVFVYGAMWGMVIGMVIAAH
jgi:hypothetical protein